MLNGILYTLTVEIEIVYIWAYFRCDPPMVKQPQTFDDWYVKSSYQDFVKQEGLPLYEGSGLENLAALPLSDWERRGGKAAYTRLGEQEIYNLQIV